MADESPLSSDTIRLLRHLVAAIAYRSRLSVKGAPAGYDELRLAEGAMNARELVNHMTNVMSYLHGRITHTDRVKYAPLDWQDEVARFYDLLGKVDETLSKGVTLPIDEDLRLVQGPLADICTHIGQLVALRRLAGSPVPGENFIKADIRAGQTSLD